MAPFPSGHTLVMGILNLTPDSFSGDGLGSDIGAAVRQARQMVLDGADVIDVGGESTAYWKAGYKPVDAAEELRRVLPVIEQLRGTVAVPISIDTRKPEVGRRALAAGAGWVNNVEGVWDDGQMAEIAAAASAPLVIMHNRREAVYSDLVAEVRDELLSAARRAEEHGVPRENVIIDPGLGFGKAGEHNLLLLQRLKELTNLGYRVLVGPSRKRFLGVILGTPEHDRVEGTAAAATVAVMNGASILRVHDVRPVTRAVRVADAIRTGRLPETTSGPPA